MALTQKQDVFTTLCITFFIFSVIFGSFAYHFLLGGGFFAGLKVDTQFWGGLFLGGGLLSTLTCITTFLKAVSLQNVR